MTAIPGLQETIVRSAKSVTGGLGDHDVIGCWCRPMLRVQPLGASLADEEQTHALQQLRGGVHAFGQESVSLGFMIVNADLAGNKDGGRLRRQFLDLRDELRAVKTGHRHIGDHEVDSALVEAGQGFFAARETGYTVAARFQHDFAVGKRLLVVIHT